MLKSSECYISSLESTVDDKIKEFISSRLMKALKSISQENSGFTPELEHILQDSNFYKKDDIELSCLLSLIGEVKEYLRTTILNELVKSHENNIENSHDSEQIIDDILEKKEVNTLFITLVNMLLHRTVFKSKTTYVLESE